MKKGKAVSFSLPSSVPRPSPPLELSLFPAGLCCLAPFQDPLSDFGARLPTRARASEVVPARVGVAPAGWAWPRGGQQCRRILASEEWGWGRRGVKAFRSGYGGVTSWLAGGV